MTKSDSRQTRNPFGVLDVREPDGPDVVEFAAQAELIGAADDPNAMPWAGSRVHDLGSSIEGRWFSRWNGGADPTLAGDTEQLWKQGTGELRTVIDRVYLLFDWADGARQALIDARRDGPQRLIGRYVNLGDPAITCPWTGLIVNNRRIDGRWPHGQLDFQR